MAQTIPTNSFLDGALDGASQLPPSDDSLQARKYLSNDPHSQQTGPEATNSPPTSTGAKTKDSEQSRAEKRFTDNWNAAYHARFAPGRKHPFVLPHKTTRFPDDPGSSLMSWWPVPENAESFEAPQDRPVPTITREKKANSLLQRLEHRLGELVFGAGEHHHSNGKTQPNGTQDISNANSLFHVVLTLTHMHKDVDSNLQGVRVCGTYDSLPVAKAFAHRCLFDAGYEQEWFTTFETQHEGILIDHKQSEIVKAIGPDGEQFVVNIATIPNVFKLKSNDSGRIVAPLYHVVQTTVHYRDDESGQTRDTTIQGSFGDFEEAKKVALSTLLWSDDGITRNTYAAYEEAGPGELDCGYGENVMVHAVGQDGENFVVSVLEGRAMESEVAEEAAAAMRS